jgi:hypothetical protein
MHGILTKMKTTEQIIDLIAERIGLLYHHNPLMYGGTPEGVETLLFYYHLLWAEIVDRVDDWRTVHLEQIMVEDAGSMAFSGKYRVDHPEATDSEAAKYATSQWRKISDKLGVPIKHEEIIKDLERDLGPKSTWKF